MAHAGLKLKCSPDVGMDRKMGISSQYCFLYLTLDTQTGFANNIREFFSSESTGQETGNRRKGLEATLHLAR